MRNFTIIALIFLSSCSGLKVDPNSNRAEYNSLSDEVLTNKKIHSASTFTRQYKVKEVFPNDELARNKLKKVNVYNLRSSIFLWSGLGLALSYLLIDGSDYSKTTYWGILAAGYIPGLYYDIKASNLMKETVKNYNIRHNYSFSPIINNRRDGRTNYGLALSTNL